MVSSVETISSPPGRYRLQHGLAEVAHERVGVSAHRPRVHDDERQRQRDGHRPAQPGAARVPVSGRSPPIPAEQRRARRRALLPEALLHEHVQRIVEPHVGEVAEDDQIEQQGADPESGEAAPEPGPAQRARRPGREGSPA
jgi:hypothetical protein